MPGYAMARDSAFYGDDDPLRFNGLRFYLPYKEEDDMSTTSSTNHARHLDYTGIEPGNISWGSGRFTCPGRWYAAAMIKLILASLLLNYDVSFPLDKLNGRKTSSMTRSCFRILGRESFCGSGELPDSSWLYVLCM
jgi:cytochrome P450